MTAINHALTGAFIGLVVGEPVVALPLAFASHFALDAIPHWGADSDDRKRITSHHFKLQLVVEAALCILVVVVLALTRPRHWLLAAICAFVATSPDLFWLKRYVVIKRTGKYLPSKNWFWHFHDLIQWFGRPSGIVVEAVWLVAILVCISIVV